MGNFLQTFPKSMFFPESESLLDINSFPLSEYSSVCWISSFVAERTHSQQKLAVYYHQCVEFSLFLLYIVMKTVQTTRKVHVEFSRHACTLLNQSNWKQPYMFFGYKMVSTLAAESSSCQIANLLLQLKCMQRARP